MNEEPTRGSGQDRAGGPGPALHEIKRAVLRLNEWFAGHKQRIPPCWNWRLFRRQRAFPAFRAVETTAIQDWSARDLNRLYRVCHERIPRADGDVEVPVELLVADKSVRGAYLEAREMLEAAFEIIAGRHLLGRCSPRLRWFWRHYPGLVSEMESFVQEIRLRVDAATPVPRDPRRVFEEFEVPLRDGQQMALGRDCMFIVEFARPPGATPFWRFSVTQRGQIIVGPQVLQPRPIYHGERLLAAIKRISDNAVTLNVLTSGDG